MVPLDRVVYQESLPTEAAPATSISQASVVLEAKLEVAEAYQGSALEALLQTIPNLPMDWSALTELVASTKTQLSVKLEDRLDCNRCSHTSIVD